MAITLTVTEIEQSPNGIQTVMGKAVFSGSYAAGGDALPLNTLIGQLSAQGSSLASTLQPITAYFESVLGGFGTGSTPGAGGYYVPVKSTLSPPTLASWLLQLFAAGGAELSAGAYPAGVTGDDVRFEIKFHANK
jgi:hypothetical protein